MARFTRPRTKEEILEEQVNKLEEQKADKLTYLEANDNEIKIENNG